MQQRKLFGSSAYSIQRRRPRLSFRWKFTRLPPRNRSEKAAQYDASNMPRGAWVWLLGLLELLVKSLP